MPLDPRKLLDPNDDASGLDPAAIAAMGQPTGAGGAVGDSALGDSDLSAMSGDATGQGDMGADEDIQLQQMQGILDDPSADPAQKAQVQQMLALAARRRLAGVDGGQ